MIRLKVHEQKAAAMQIGKPAAVSLFVEGGEPIPFVVNNIAMVYAGGTDPYEGPYSVTPKVDAQSLETRDKYMKNDVTIKAIPYYNVSNTSGGSTVYIGKEI